MTVTQTPSLIIVQCMWFDDRNALHKEMFPTDTLKVVE
jgi:uncharacterized protein YodC (DUF2158 family)